ncbi:Hemocyte protein-glutamine gamma-glutamyltransferase-like protein [Aphelenchoides bicaudatus]|nr:Hemocyte protein-glutamine gamma-glutamyltransferase-like protein [Aphelenchoides bicaudatus]
MFAKIPLLFTNFVAAYVSNFVVLEMSGGKLLSTCFDLCRLTLQPNINNSVHFTENYLWQSHRKLVARRGFPVQILLIGTLDFDPENHTIILQFDLDNGNASQPDRETHRHVQLEQKLNQQLNQKEEQTWSAELIKADGTQIDLQLNIPVNEIVGCWRLRVFIGQQSTESHSLTLHESYVSAQQRTKLYLICNPFHEKDDTYFEQRSFRDYYLNQQADLWFSGTAVGTNNNYTFHKEPWLNSQFEENTMKTVMLLLERLSYWQFEHLRGGLTYADRRCVVRIARKLSFAINYVLLNQHDESNQGSLSSLDRPLNEWISTEEIIDEFIQSRQPVPCSDSYVYANAFVSLLRCIGICSRTVTCIESAHDSDLSLTVDRAYFRAAGGHSFAPMKRNENFEWESNSNYHVWTELYIKRPDLSSEYDGWQVLDATPQEHNANVSQCGPASIKAIREGRFELPYDCWFFWGQLNADVVRWFYEHNEESNEYRLLKTDFKCGNRGIGRAVLTPNPRAFGYPMDLINEYKSDIENSAYIKSVKSTGLMDRQERIRLLYANDSNPNITDVEFVVKEIGWVVYGDDISVQVEFKNVSSEKPESLKLFTPIADYSRHMTTHRSLVAIVSASVEQTSQLFYHEEKIQLAGSAVAIIAPAMGQINETLVGIVAVRNPLSETLTNVELLLNSGNSGKSTRINRFPSEIHPGQRIKVHVRFKPTQLGNRFLMAIVNSSQIRNLTALHLFRAVPIDSEYD